MGQGGNKTQRVDIIDSYDPRITGRAAQKGTIFRFIPASGDPEILIKLDDGFSTSWASLATSALPITTVDAASVADVTIATAPATIDGVAYTSTLLKNQAAPAENGVYDFNGAGNPLTRSAGWDEAAEFVPGRQVFVDGGTVNADTLWANADYVAVLDTDPVSFVKVSSSAVVGDPDTLAYFDAGGNLTDNTSAKFNGIFNSMAIGIIFGGATIDATGNGSFARGDALNSGAISATGSGSYAYGYVDGVGSLLSATAEGATVFGSAYGGSIIANVAGALAFGDAETAGTITAQGVGAMAHGQVENSGTMLAQAIGAVAHGTANTSGSVSCIGHGSRAAGYADDSAVISVSNTGAEAIGRATNVGSNITASALGSRAMGLAISGGGIVASGDGSFAHGAADTGTIQATSTGSIAIGRADGNNITSSGLGSFAGGYSSAGISASGLAGFSFGNQITNTADYGFTIGLGQVSTSYACLMIGRFGVGAGFTTGAWVATDPVFIVGNGTAIGTPATGYRIDKDGKQYTTAAHIDQLRVIVGNDTLSARTDYKAICNQPGGGAFALTFPPGEQGLNFIIGQSAANTATFTITPTGLDVLDANIQTIFDSNQPVPVTYDSASGTWFAI